VDGWVGGGSQVERVKVGDKWVEKANKVKREKSKEGKSGNRKGKVDGAWGDEVRVLVGGAVAGAGGGAGGAGGCCGVRGRQGGWEGGRDGRRGNEAFLRLAAVRIRMLSCQFGRRRRMA
jgi:hypothetical protein